MVYAYPPFPSFAGGIGGFIIGLLEWAIEIPLIALANMFTGITGASTPNALKLFIEFCHVCPMKPIMDVVSVSPAAVAAPVIPTT